MIQGFIKEAELEFIGSDFKKLIDSIKTGVDQIQTVILALRIFSRLDEY